MDGRRRLLLTAGIEAVSCGQRHKNIGSLSPLQGCLDLDPANATKGPGRVDGAIRLSSSFSSS
jgi:hypothetical protein